MSTAAEKNITDYVAAVRNHARSYTLHKGALVIRDGSANGGRRDRMRVEMTNSRAAELRVVAESMGRDFRADLVAVLS